jgi:hypothetical protein
VEKPKVDREQLVGELVVQWRTLWRDRIDDKVRAEGIANMDYSLLFVERGTVIIAPRDYKPLDFYEILEQHRVHNADNMVPPNPSVGGWGKFVKSVLRKQSFIRRERPAPPELNGKKGQQQKKGGRGWLHIRMP